MRTMRMLGRTLVALAMVAVFTAVEAGPVGATSDSNSNPNNYLALGDSVPFGYNPLLVAPGVNPDLFVGYPELASELFRPRKKLFNASCPGETSTSFITGTRPDNGCQNYRQFIGQLHVAYTGSQLAYATNYLQANPRTGLVTISIGANDLFLLRNSCAPAPNPTGCILAGLPDLLKTLAANLTTIYSALDAAGFHGELMAVTYYAANYADPAEVFIISQINDTITSVTTAFGGVVADGFKAFQKVAAGSGGSSCAAGLLIVLPDGSCNIHPSPAGAALLAEAVRNAV